ncbi:unnamed protein product [Linum trigynum]|uniref:Membrane-associated kinase regulator 1 n=1 Tax=Linum trigynum TaxID=586398 RepID=A0AAV2FEV6_9ROSI
MGKRREKLDSRSSQTLPPSPSHSFSSSSSSDFEFTISLSPRKSSPAICPADELFYKGQLLPLHLSPRISMVRTLLLASSSTSSSSDATASRDSTGSTSSSTSSSSAASSDLLLLAVGDSLCDSSRPSSAAAADELADELKRLTGGAAKKNGKYFSLSRFSSVFKKDSSKSAAAAAGENSINVAGSSVRRMSTTAKDVIRKYLKKVKPLYEKLSHKQQQQKMGLYPNGVAFASGDVRSGKGNVVSDPAAEEKVIHRSSSGTVEGSSSNSNKTAPVRGFSHSFSGNLRYPRKRSSIASSCPSSMRSSPSHSGVLSRSGFASGSGTNNNNNNNNNNTRPGGAGSGGSYGDASSMEELQSAIQGAIAHCKNSMMMPPPPPQRKGKGILISNEV